MPKKLDRYEFIWKAIQVHGYKDDYREVNYINNDTEVVLIDSKNIKFKVTPHTFLKGYRNKLSRKKRKGNPLYTFKQIKDRIIKEKGDAYDFSLVKYSDNDIIPLSTIVTLRCKKCNNLITRSLKAHFRYNCPFHKKITFEIFKERGNKIHNYKYIYNEDKYKGYCFETIITCPIHGDFKQIPYNHINGDGCPKCNQSKLEIEVSILLSNNNIVYDVFKKFDWLGRKSLDFYLPDYNVAIECQGKQHFESVVFFGGEKGLILTIKRDELKNKLCKEHNIPIIYYTNQKQIKNYSLGKLIYNKEDLLKEILKYGNNQ